MYVNAENGPYYEYVFNKTTRVVQQTTRHYTFLFQTRPTSNETIVHARI